ncbi:hypothetical protein ACFL0V_07220 [Nanoarchaeota archaeon]
MKIRLSSKFYSEEGVLSSASLFENEISIEKKEDHFEALSEDEDLLREFANCCLAETR